MLGKLGEHRDGGVIYLQFRFIYGTQRDGVT